MRYAFSERYEGPTVNMCCTTKTQTLALSQYVTMRYGMLPEKGGECYVTKVLLVMPN